MLGLQVLSLAEANKDLIRADPLQRLHTMHNLAEQMAMGLLPVGMARTLRDGSLAQEAAEIRNHYLAETAAKLAAAAQELRTSLDTTADARKQAVTGGPSSRGEQPPDQAAHDHQRWGSE